MLLCKSYLRINELENETKYLFSNHDNKQLNTNISETSRRIASFNPSSLHSVVFRWTTNDQTAFEKRDVKQRRISVNKLKYVHLERGSVLILGLRSRILPVGEKHCDVNVNNIK